MSKLHSIFSIRFFQKKMTKKFIDYFLVGFFVISSITLHGTIFNYSRVLAANSSNKTEVNLSSPNDNKVGICIAGFCINIPEPLKRPIEGPVNSLIKDQLRSFLKDEIPITGTEHKLYPTTLQVPGGQFTPQILYLNALNSSQVIPPGDYEIPVHYYCTKVYTLNGAGNRYRLARLNGRLSNVLSTLYQRASLNKVPIQDVQVLSWSIQSGVSYDNLSSSSKQLVNQLIPDYRQQLEGSFTDKTIKYWNSISQLTPLPSFDATLNQLGDIGKFAQSLLRARQEIINTNFSYGALANAFVIPQDVNLPGGMETTPWSQINEQVYLRFIAPKGALNDGVAQVRIVGRSQTKKLNKVNLIKSNVESKQVISSLPGNNNRSASSVTAEALLSNISQSVGIPEQNGQALTATVTPAPENRELQEAREIARRLREEYPGWKESLDPCPCTVAEARANPNFRDATNDYKGLYREYKLPKYHPGANFDFRSSKNRVKPFASQINREAPPLMPGQQCIYDQAGNLITSGEGAGTPDAYSPEVTGVGKGWTSNDSHTFWDTKPFDADGMTWQEYQQVWTPNNGNGCPLLPWRREWNQI